MQSGKKWNIDRGMEFELFNGEKETNRADEKNDPWLISSFAARVTKTNAWNVQSEILT